MELRARIYPIRADMPIVVMNEEDAKDMGVYVSGRVVVEYRGKEVVAIADTTKIFVKEGEIGLFEDIRDLLGVRDGSKINVIGAKRPSSVEFIKKKLNGHSLSNDEIRAIIKDIVDNNLSNIELSAFVVGGYVNGYTMDEIVALTSAMVETGQQIDFGNNIVDKHCIGGVAGNRTTMIIVPIIAAAGLTIPKTSSRAITSPAGTADTMEVLAPVEFDVDELKRIVSKANACIVWGGAVNLAPADDKIIRVEYPLSLDAEGHMLASVIAKKKSVGSDYLIIDIPIGKGAKIDDTKRANSLANKFIELGKRLGISVECLITDGSCPIGSGIGPALEARDVLLALENKGPVDLINKSLDLAGALLELAGRVVRGKGRGVAEHILNSGRAKKKMREIIEAQGGDPEIGVDDIDIGNREETITSEHKGRVRHIDNGIISRIARAAGAPRSKGSGIYMHVSVGDCVNVGDPLFTIYSSTNSRLEDAVRLSQELSPIRVGSIIRTL
ncbi:MAG: AMP phosphorylase [Candidatus Altiarchaeales archaeon]|nr:MAG: AMP phosphorylase [Candidatus Altiarchaeales archaeon]RLI95173.1 MAG: AMP phosphorylase [Candidatus Altiarchaeales archaeon]RLI95443.1 MAG: AMP phosphorylase [Candidatus Altiarchaeales archaeon]HDO82120.1 AMP phosphorylase [Candidatus Altiarchaeales archaeon]HEX54769.1 AMP phosphorylase [Candidatus Altiarchaeales archaeon]